MTLKVLDLIYLIHKAPLSEEGKNEIAFTTVYCTRFIYVANCFKNTYYSCIQKQDTEVLCFCVIFIVWGFFYVIYIHSFNFILNLLANN